MNSHRAFRRHLAVMLEPPENEASLPIDSKCSVHHQQIDVSPRAPLRRHRGGGDEALCSRFHIRLSLSRVSSTVSCSSYSPSGDLLLSCLPLRCGWRMGGLATSRVSSLCGHEVAAAAAASLLLIDNARSAAHSRHVRLGAHRRARWATLRFFHSGIIRIPSFRSAIPAPLRSSLLYVYDVNFIWGSTPKLAISGRHWPGFYRLLYLYSLVLPRDKFLT